MVIVGGNNIRVLKRGYLILLVMATVILRIKRLCIRTSSGRSRVAAASSSLGLKDLQLASRYMNIITPVHVVSAGVYLKSVYFWLQNCFNIV